MKIAVMFVYITFIVVLCVVFECAAQDSLNVRLLGGIHTPNDADGVSVAGGYAYVAAWDAGLQVVDIANPTAPVEVGFCDTPGEAWDVVVSGNYAYVADNWEGVRVVNVSNPATPIEVGFLDTPGAVWSVCVVGNYVYVVDYYSLRIANITNPSVPTEVGFCAMPTGASYVTVAGGYAYVAAWDAGLRVVDIANPTAPVEVGFYDTPGVARGVAVTGGHAYVADAEGGLRVIDISNPTATAEVGSCTTYCANGVAVAGRYAYVADSWAGLRVVDIGNPALPLEVGYYDRGNYAANDVKVAGYYAYVAASRNLDIYAVAILKTMLPNGGETWHVFSHDTVRWESFGYEGAVRIELNRNYPSGAWEVLSNNTENDGEEVVWISDPPSIHCRIRIADVEDTVVSDISDGDFFITSSQGYLALVRISAPTVPMLNWNIGSVECPQTANEWFHLKNFGSEAVVVFQPPEPPTAEFSRTTSCGLFFALTPGQMSTCSLRLRYNPQAEGTHRDTLVIQTDAVNQQNGYVRIPLSGSQMRTPAVPQVVITTPGSDARLTWFPISESVSGCPISVTHYLVFYSPTFVGPYYYHGYTADTTYVHLGVVHYASGQFYNVTATTAPLPLLARIPRDTPREEVEALLREAE